jgi:hypothetical protein
VPLHDILQRVAGHGIVVRIDSSYNGLLGMNFLKGLSYTIDFERQVIVWHS